MNPPRPLPRFSFPPCGRQWREQGSSVNRWLHPLPVQSAPPVHYRASDDSLHARSRLHPNPPGPPPKLPLASSHPCTTPTDCPSLAGLFQPQPFDRPSLPLCFDIHHRSPRLSGPLPPPSPSATRHTTPRPCPCYRGASTLVPSLCPPNPSLVRPRSRFNVVTPARRTSSAGRHAWHLVVHDATQRHGVRAHSLLSSPLTCRTLGLNQTLCR